MVYDCLDARGKDLRERPLRSRRQVLESEVDGHRFILPARRLANEGLTASWPQREPSTTKGEIGAKPGPYEETSGISGLGLRARWQRHLRRCGAA
jgi:hypothetical protein